jgi:hypothetical protein
MLNVYERASGVILNLSLEERKIALQVVHMFYASCALTE